MEIVFDFFNNLINAVQGNLIGLFLIIGGFSILVKVTSNIIKIIVSVIILIIFFKILMDMGLIGVNITMLA